MSFLLPLLDTYYKELCSKCSILGHMSIFSLSKAFKNRRSASCTGNITGNISLETVIGSLGDVTTCVFFRLFKARPNTPMFKFVSYCYRIWTVCLSNAASLTVCSASCSLDPEYCMQGIAICISISKGTAKVQWHTACSLLKSDIISTISTIPAPP